MSIFVSTLVNDATGVDYKNADGTVIFFKLAPTTNQVLELATSNKAFVITASKTLREIMLNELIPEAEVTAGLRVVYATEIDAAGVLATGKQFSYLSTPANLALENVPQVTALNSTELSDGHFYISAAEATPEANVWVLYSGTTTIHYFMAVDTPNKVVGYTVSNAGVSNSAIASTHWPNLGFASRSDPLPINNFRVNRAKKLVAAAVA